MPLIRLALRALLRARGFTSGATLTFALGVGINITVFAAVDRLLLRPLPFADAHRLFLMTGVDEVSGQRINFLPGRIVAEARERLPGVEVMATLGDSSGYYLSPDLAEPEIRLSSVSYEMLELSGVRPVMGRGFTDEDDRSGIRVAILTHEGWQSRFGGDPDVLGRHIYWRDGAMEVVGVLPPGYIPAGGFIDPNISGLTQMFDTEAGLAARPRSVPPTVRLRPGVSPQAAQAALDALVARLAPELPPADPGTAIRLIPIREAMFGRFKPYALLVSVGAGLVLLVTCASLAGLFLVRSRVRQWDSAVRATLGASSGRLLLDALIEPALICAAGTALALVAYQWTWAAIGAMVPDIFSRFAAGSADVRVGAFAVGAGVAASVLTAMAPAWQATRSSAWSVIQRGGPASTTRLGPGRWILAVEAALAVVLVAAAAVTARSLATLSSADLGFDPTGLHLILWRPVPGLGPEAMHAQTLRLVDAISALPGVDSAAAAPAVSVLRTGQAPFGPNGPPCCRFFSSANYLDLIRVPVLAGRTFTPADTQPGVQVAVVSARGAQWLWPGEPPGAAIGRTVSFDGEPTRHVIGVVGDTRRSYDEDLLPTIHLPLAAGGATLIVARTAAAAALPYATVRPAVDALPGAALVYVRPMEPMYGRVLEAPRFRALLFGAFASVALAVALVGLYAIASYDVAARRREVGLRKAIGASNTEIVRLVLLDALRPVMAGVAVGVGIVIVAASTIEAFLYRVDARDPGTLALVVVLLLVTATLAAWIPARRAASTDPAIVLRST